MINWPIPSFIGELYTFGGRTWEWNGKAWIGLNTPIVGPIGATGATGPQGVQGVTGSTGATGPQGIQGVTGSIGATGSIGVTGATGATGPQGVQGVTGSIGATGATGPQGIQGVTGSTGATGATGADGPSGPSTGKTYWFNKSEISTIATYSVLSTMPIMATQSVVSGVANGTTNANLVDSYITEELGFTIIPGGSQIFHLHFVKPASNDELYAYVELQLADSLGVPYPGIFTTSVEYIGWNAGNPALVLPEITLVTGAILTTDRFICRIYVNNLDSTNHAYSFYTEGAQYYSYVLTSLEVVGSPGPTGPQGPIGATGPTGAIGATGPQGIQGVTGATGADGAVGATGPQGIQGPIGATGADGAVGATGPQGIQGVTGATGPQGIQGPIGATGAVGATGAQGATGSLPAGTVVLIDANEIESTGTTTTSSVKTYTVAANTYTRIMAEAECGFRSNANANGTVRFEIRYGLTIKRSADIEFDATGAGDQHAAGYTLKYSESFTGGGQISIDAQSVANGTWTIESLRIYGII